MPHREVFWNITYHNLVYPLTILTMTIFILGFNRRIKHWKLGQKKEIEGSFIQRLKSVLVYALGQGRILKERYPALMHGLIFLGFLILFIGTTTVSFDYDVWHLIFGQASFLVGNFYEVFSYALDIAGVLTLLGILIALFRRYIQRPERLNSVLDNAVILCWIFVILVSGFLVEGARITATSPGGEAWSPIGTIVSRLFSINAADWHRFLWWGHLLLSLGFIAYIPFSRLKHIFSSATNIYLRSFRPSGELQSIDIEKAEIFGAGKINDFSWKDLLDLDACTSCGRCQDQCPAYASQKPLSPKKIILDLLENLNSTAPKLFKGESLESAAPLVGSAVQADEVWSCTTCAACVEACPVFIEHIDKIVELRRDRVLMEGDFPAELNATFKGMENNSNPWGIGFSKRADWADGLEIKRLDNGARADVLWFVGCAGSFDDRIKKISGAFANILKSADVDFGILGAEEKCCGETARRLGNEYLAQTLMEMNIEMFKELGVKKIITFCPHCYNTLKNEYPQFKGNYEVLHSTEFLFQLMEAGKIKLNKNGKTKMTYHDSCYLGRYSKIYEEPREIIKNVSNLGLVEMKRNRAQSFCCGAGGGRMWLDETIGERINNLRTDQVIQSGAEAVVSACPYCLTMLSDGIKDRDAVDKIKAMDIIELVEEALVK